MCNEAKSIIIHFDLKANSTRSPNSKFYRLVTYVMWNHLAIFSLWLNCSPPRWRRKWSKISDLTFCIAYNAHKYYVDASRNGCSGILIVISRAHHIDTRPLANWYIYSIQMIWCNNWKFSYQTAVASSSHAKRPTKNLRKVNQLHCNDTRIGFDSHSSSQRDVFLFIRLFHFHSSNWSRTSSFLFLIVRLSFFLHSSHQVVYSFGNL